MKFDTIFQIEPFRWSAIGTALFCGFIVGLERQLRGKPVGIRTSSLIVLGTQIFMTLSIWLSNAATDPSRIIGQLVTGVGFLGAGVMLTRDGVVVGVTSAATIWVLSAIGVVISAGELFTAIKLAVIVVLILSGVDLLEDYSTALTRGVHSKYSDWKSRSDRRNQSNLPDADS